VTGRIIAQHLMISEAARRRGKPPGAGSASGQYVANAAPDGYTLMSITTRMRSRRRSIRAFPMTP
jgi:hypothetical protein